jgi:coenzyme F420-reducing hydrogenase gamma subunit
MVIIIILITSTFVETKKINKTSSISKPLETSLNMGYYDINNYIPIDLTFNGCLQKNKEIQQLVKYIKKNNIFNVLVIADRAYFNFSV